MKKLLRVSWAILLLTLISATLVFVSLKLSNFTVVYSFEENEEEIHSLVTRTFTDFYHFIFGTSQTISVVQGGKARPDEIANFGIVGTLMSGFVFLFLGLISSVASFVFSLFKKTKTASSIGFLSFVFFLIAGFSLLFCRWPLVKLIGPYFNERIQADYPDYYMLITDFPSLVKRTSGNLWFSLIPAFSFVACFLALLYSCVLVRCLDENTAPLLSVPHSGGLEYLSMNKSERFLANFKSFFVKLGYVIVNFFISIPTWIAKLLKKIGDFFVGLWEMFVDGDWKTRLSFLIFGFGNITNKQIGRGLLLFAYQVLFILYMVFFGNKYLSKFSFLGTVETTETATGFKVVGDNSFQILLYSVLTLTIILFTIFLWYKSVKMAYENRQNMSLAKRLPNFRDDFHQSLNTNFHTTLLSVPLLTLVVFTVVPLIFMIFVAFTDYDGLHMPPQNLFTWVGNDNFSSLLNGSGLAGNAANWSYTFWNVLWWTLLWAVLATFSNFFLGMLIAMIINKKGLKLKKLWRTLLVVVIAVPQFISLLLMSKMLTPDGAYNILLEEMGMPKSKAIEWLLNPWMARLSVVLVNLWIGIPYTVLSCTGILMNIPEDLYEAARIDGANPRQMYRKITLPYMMFVMGPSLITTFVGNLNNFNVIYLLTGGTTGYPDSKMSSCYAGQTDLLITWLYKLTVNNQYYGIASVIGILVFIITAFFSLIVYGNIGSVKNEEEFQ